MTTVERRPVGGLIPEVVGLFEAAWPFGPRHSVQVEDYFEDGTYVLRAELPGLDADSDIAVSTTGDRLTITAEREQRAREQHRSEFRYGSFTRTVTLPKGADADAMTATYRKGILEVRVPVAENAGARKIRVEAQED
ncbi:Hsp20/alpha crystallin family protein [Actinosynnema sp. NPDC059335]|uniref:Hsp20/alpha crystallin family protein n=1 Tax=Actinosynnema sp. NPDC059335 TaxID=3346804 RepID=UPI0036731926